MLQNLNSIIRYTFLICACQAYEYSMNLELDRFSLLCSSEAFGCEPQFLLHNKYNVIPVLVPLCRGCGCHCFPVQCCQILLNKINNMLFIPNNDETSWPEDAIHLNQKIFSTTTFLLNVRKHGPGMKKVISSGVS